jgi:Tfp pilus assembly protein PilX
VKRLRSVRKEQGVALPIAMAIMTVLAVALVAVIGFTSAGARHSDSSQAENDAFAVAEAGINVALSLLGTASAGQMYGSFATAASYKLILGEQVG